MTNGGSRRFLGRGLPYVDVSGLGGRLFVVEGTDGVGRSTQIELLKDWLELQGHAVVTTGWTRSTLMSAAIEDAKEGHSLNRLTFSLLYACDFADRLENEILPALRSGMIVVADRYCYTAFARNTVRGVPEAWTRDLFGFALEPDVVIYLDIDVEALVRRVIRRGKLDHWESGLDLALGEDPYDSFVVYQKRLLERYQHMSEAEGFEVVDARRSIDEIQLDVRHRIAAHLPGTATGHTL
jgi:dTMP kinase